MKRIAIIGNAGAGKSTLAERLAKALEVPHHSLDHILWKPGWDRVPVSEFNREHRAYLSGEAWVIDGFGDMPDVKERITAADTILFIGMPLWRHYWWMLKRQIKSIFRPDPYVPEGCSLLAVTWPLITMMWDIHKNYRPGVMTLLDQMREEKAIHELRSPQQIERFLREATAGRLRNSAP